MPADTRARVPVNASDDIPALGARALDLVGVRHRRPRRRVIAVSRPDDVRRLDEATGPGS